MLAALDSGSGVGRDKVRLAIKLDERGAHVVMAIACLAPDAPTRLMPVVRWVPLGLRRLFTCGGPDM